MQRRRAVGLLFFISVLAVEIVLSLSLRSLRWSKTITLTRWAALSAVLLIAVVVGWTLFRRWSRARFRYGVTHLLLGYATLCGLIALLAAFYGRPYLERYNTRALRQLGVRVYGSADGATGSRKTISATATW